MTNPPSRQAIGVALLQLRRAQHLTLEEVERDSGVSKSSLSRIEHGQIAVSLEQTLALLEVYSFSVTELVRRASAIEANLQPLLEPT